MTVSVERLLAAGCYLERPSRVARTYSLDELTEAGFYCPAPSRSDIGDEIQIGEDISKKLPLTNQQRLRTIDDPKWKSGDKSRQDEALMCAILAQGHTPEDTLATFLASPRGDNVRQRKNGHSEDYLQRTVRKALDWWDERKDKPALLSVEVVDSSKKRQAFEDSDLPEQCLDGWLGEVCQKKMPEFPRAFSWLALLAAASVLIPAETRMRCNLFVALVGALHSGKSSACERAFQLLGLKGEPKLLELKAGSAEGLAEYVGNLDGEPRLLYPDELAHLLEKSMIERSSFPRFLTTAFYSDQQQLTVMKRKAVNFNARLSILGGVVEDQFGDLFGSATTGGLHDRFLFGRCPRGYKYLWRDKSGEKPILREPVTVRLHSSVFDERDRWITELKIEPRVAELCLRVATICAAFSQRPLLTRSMMRPALALAKYQMRARIVLQPNPGEHPDAKCAFKVRTYLEQNARGEWIARRRVYRSINGVRLGPGVFDRTLRNLEFNGEIESGKSGRESMIRLVQDAKVASAK
jgi:hypothetical protein